MGLTAVGLGSGLQINEIVSALVNAEKAPKEASLNSRQASVTAEVSAIGSIKSALTTFKDAVSKLTDAEKFNAKKASTNQSDFLSASANKDAVAGSYNIKVEQLAESQKLGTAAVATATSTLGAGKVDLTVNGESFSIDVEKSDTLKSLVAKINESSDNKGVTATIITDDTGSRMVMTSDKTGTANTISVNATGDAGLTNVFNSTTELQAAKDSIIQVDGLKVTSSSNSVDKAIDGVTLNLKKADVGETTQVTIAKDTGTVKKNIEGFVKSYNELMDSVTDLTRYDPTTKRAAALTGDALPRSIQSQLRSTLGSTFDTANGAKSLAMFGVSTDRYGKLTIDNDKLTDTLKNDSASLAELFSKSETGLANKLSGIVDSYVKSGGILDSRDTSLQNQLTRITDERTDLTTRMKRFEDRMYKQFNAMDSIVGQLNRQGAAITQRLKSLPGVTRQSRNNN